jgi:hypothetical protein
MRSNILFEIPVEAHFDAFFDIDYQIDFSTGVGTMSTYDQQGRVISQAKVESGVVKITVYSGADGKGRDVPIELVSLQAYDENGSMKGNAETTWKVEKGEK